MVWGTISWACFGPPGSALHLLTMPLIDARLGLMTWMLQHWEEERAETGSSSFCAVPSADQIPPSLQHKSCLELKQPAWGRYMQYPGPRREMNERETTEDLSVPLTGTSVSAVKFPEMKDIQQANSALAFSFSRKRSKISNHGHASLTGTWWPGHTLIRINDRR